MSGADSKHAFALTLKRWFNSNGWPQKITDDWAKDEADLLLIQEKLAGLSRLTLDEIPEGWWPDCPVRKALESLAA